MRRPPVFPNAYHKRHTRAQRLEANNEAQKKHRVTDIRAKEVIVWDGEGMKLSGEDKPQHYVLFGCSVRPDHPLVITEPDGRLSFEQIADYCMDVVKAHPNAIHLGYFFRYDQNMIIWDLPWPTKRALYERGACRIKRNGKLYIIRCVFGKTIRITRIKGENKKSILIEDIAAFFGTSFVKAYNSLFPVPTNPDNWAIVVEGKKQRADMLYADMPDVRRYWRAEIKALEELACEFRRLMFDGGFMLTQWYGPGALANYLRRRHGLVRHEWGGKEDNLPPAVLAAVKGAFYGGHIEQFKVGVVKGPIYQYDVNSAYPSAFRHVPSLSEGGEWRHLGAIDSDTWWKRPDLRNRFALYFVRWRGKNSNPKSLLGNLQIQPLPHRSQRDEITYPSRVNGWYWAPEVSNAMQFNGRGDIECEILDGWVWEPAEPVTFPWNILMEELYAARLILKDEDNPVQMGYKLSMNSLYGKMAQRAGGKDKPPGSHTLPIAGFVTSFCRAMVMKLMLHCIPGSVISVETDGVFTTTPPEKLRGDFPRSNKLGEWGVKVYDEMIIIQNGVYMLRKGDKWEPPKSRGIPARAINPETLKEHLALCVGERWPSLVFDNQEAFIGLGAAISRATKKNKWDQWSTNPFKASRLHCTWKQDSRTIDIEGHGSKRSHFYKSCRHCMEGIPPTDIAHDMVIYSRADQLTAGPTEITSSSYTLPWEKNYEVPEWRIRIDQDDMFADDSGTIR
jgi:hypothetical protein